MDLDAPLAHHAGIRFAKFVRHLLNPDPPCSAAAASSGMCAPSSRKIDFLKIGCPLFVLCFGYCLIWHLTQDDTAQQGVHPVR